MGTVAGAAPRLDGLAHLRWLDYWREARTWVRRYLYYAWAAAGVLVLLYLAFIATIKGPVLVNSALTLAALVALIYLFATPRATLPVSAQKK